MLWSLPEVEAGIWDLVIAHPPCTYLSYAGTRYWHQPGRARKRIEALSLFLDFLELDCKFVCVENPQGVIPKVIREPDQTIHPYYFGDPYMKRTCLWLKNLPLLNYKMHDDMFGKRTACDKPAPVYVEKSGKRRHFTDSQAASLNGSSCGRSRSFEGIARAMAEQWSEFILQSN